MVQHVDRIHGHIMNYSIVGSITDNTSEIERLFQLWLVSFIKVSLEHLNVHAAQTVKSEVLVDMLGAKIVQQSLMSTIG